MHSLVQWVRHLRRSTQASHTRLAYRPVVELLEDRRLLTAYMVTTTRDLLGDVTRGEVTLRDVLTAISTQRPSGNAAAGTASNTVAFAIGTRGTVQTIDVKTALPSLTHQAFIDGWSQGGTSYAGPPLIVLNGAGAAKNVDALTLLAGSSKSTVRGLAIQQFGSEGIVLRGTVGDQIVGNWIGVNNAGTARLGSNSAGVLLDSGATGNTVGGTAAGSANVIAANGPAVEIKDAGTSGNVVLGNLIGTNKTGSVYLGALAGVEVRAKATANTIGGTAAGSANVIAANGPGVEIMDAGTSRNVVLGNLIGTDRTGTVKLGTLAGVEIRGQATGNTVGGTAAGSDNVISGSLGPGVEIKDAGTSGNVVLGNLIGTDITGTAKLGNTTYGVLLRAGAASNTIGGTAAGSGNAIAFNAKGVVVVDAATTGDSILGNSIWGNAGIGIDLGNDGPTPNGANPRAFPNHGQNTPIIKSLALNSVSGTLTSVPRTTFRLEFFATPAGGSPGQGQIFLGFLNVTTNAAGTVSFTAPVTTIPVGSVVTATATNLTTGDTSEFSPGVS